jgi:peptidyl-prolyl cis-trans isomerase SurA
MAIEGPRLMKQPFALFLLAIATATALPTHAQLLPQAATGKQPLDRIVAVVDEGVILQSELNEAVRSVQQQYARNPGQLPPMDVLQRQVLDRLILMRLQVQRADDQGIRVSDADVDKAVAAVAQQNHMSSEQLRAAVEQDGSSWSPSACTTA